MLGVGVAVMRQELAVQNSGYYDAVDVRFLSELILSCADRRVQPKQQQP